MSQYEESAEEAAEAASGSITLSASSSGAGTADTGGTSASGGSIPDDIPAERIKDYRKVFKKYDKDGDGAINTRELMTVVQGLHHAGTSAADLQLMLQEADLDNDGEISFKEFCIMMYASSQRHLRELRKAFHIVDLDSDGKLSEKELQTVMAQLGRPLTQKQARRMIKAADEDKDGLVDFKEFAHMFGFKGDVEDKEESDTAYTSSDTETSIHGEEASFSEVSAAPRGYINIKARAFYLQQNYNVRVKANATVKDFIELLAQKSGDDPASIRIYHKGFYINPAQSKKSAKEKNVKIRLTLKKHGITDGAVISFVHIERGFRLSHDDCFRGSTPQLKNIFDVFMHSELLRVEDALDIITRAKKLLRSEHNLLNVSAPCRVIGDIHGQFFDLPSIFKACGGHIWELKDTSFVFLGDYVDRGYFSAEVTLYLLAAKLAFPDRVFLLRGNHESRKTSKKYGTLEEFEHKYSLKVYNKLMECFDCLPLYALIEMGADKRMLAMHGGLSPKTPKLSDIERIDRFHEPPMTGPLKDCLWTDPYEDCQVAEFPTMPTEYNLDELPPVEEVEFSDVETAYRKGFKKSSRGDLLTTYGHQAVCAFLEENDLLCICRAHEQKPLGYEMYKSGPKWDFPAIITVFSAPNYVDKSMNDGCLLVIEDDKVAFKSYKWALHPIYHPWNSKQLAFQRDIKHEDFLQYVAWLRPSVLRTMPLYLIKAEFLKMFMVEWDRNEHGKTVEGPQWHFFSDNLHRLLRLGSKDASVRRLHRAKTKAMDLWYLGYDHYTDGFESEKVYERDVTADDDEKERKFGCIGR